mgnify:CR=1 FL=1
MTWQQAVERTVTGLGYELVDLERSGGGLLRVFIDRVPGKAYPSGESQSVTVDDCETVTRQFQYVLEVEQCDYSRMEVSSPGLDRPLKREADYARFAGSPLNACFVSDLEALVANSGAALWIHGHTHDSFDYRLGGTRVLANPRGYVCNGEAENPDFDPGLTVQVG